MNKQELDFILQEGEGLTIEFKEGFDSKDFAVALTSFANASGGKIFLGVTDSGEIKGYELTNKLKSQIIDAAKSCDPPLNIRIRRVEGIIIIEVEESRNKPHKSSSGFYTRQGASSVKLSRDQIVDLINEEGKVRFDESINRDFEYPQEFDSGKLNEYLEKAGIKG